MASTTTVPAVAADGHKARNVSTKPLIAPSVIVLFLWMIVPLAMTLWFSFQYYNLLDPQPQTSAGETHFGSSDLSGRTILTAGLGGMGGEAGYV